VRGEVGVPFLDQEVVFRSQLLKFSLHIRTGRCILLQLLVKETFGFFQIVSEKLSGLNECVCSLAHVTKCFSMSLHELWESRLVGA
jgi:hypothetical protein